MGKKRKASGKKRWSEMGLGRRVSVVFGGVVQVGLLGAALWDMWHRPPSQIRGDRRMWMAVAFVNYVGPLAYFAFGRQRSQG